MDKGIAYAPDFVLNAGGLISVYNEYLGAYNRERTYEQAEKIYDSILSIAVEAEAHGIAPQDAAIKLAKNRIQAIGKIKLSYWKTRIIAS